MRPSGYQICGSSEARAESAGSILSRYFVQVTPVDPEPLNQTRPVRVVVERLSELALPRESVILAVDRADVPCLSFAVDS